MNLGFWLIKKVVRLLGRLLRVIIVLLILSCQSWLELKRSRFEFVSLLKKFFVFFKGTQVHLFSSSVNVFNFFYIPKHQFPVFITVKLGPV